MTSIPCDQYISLLNYLHEEAELLDGRKYREWLSITTEDVVYRMFLTDFISSVPGEEKLIPIMDEDRKSLERRVNRLYLENAWSENPPSHTLRVVSNLRVSSEDNVYLVNSNVVFYRDRGDLNSEILFARRKDQVISFNGKLRLRKRDVIIPDTVLKVKDVSFIL